MDVEQDRRRLLATNQPTRRQVEPRSVRAQQLIDASLALWLDGLRGPLKRCLGEFERKLFGLAESAHRHLDQQDFYASRQRMLQGHSQFEEHFLACLTASFESLGAATEPSPPASGNPWLSLELLDPADQEKNMALAQLAARGDMRHGTVLYELGYRLGVLVAGPPLEGEALPLGAHAIGQAAQQAGTALELPQAHQVLLLQGLDGWLMPSLGPVYAAINEYLQADGILPQLRSIAVPRQLAKRPTAEKTSAAADAAEAPRANVGSPQANPPGGSIEVLESLRDLLAQRRGGGVDGQPVGRAASTDELQAALGALQQHLAQVTDQAGRELRSAQRLRDELLTQLNLDKPAGVPRTQLTGEQGDTVELVAMLFEQLGQQLQRGGNAQALLGNLQLPVLRMAVADKNFFEQHEHPARKLLDTVAAAANDWLDGSDDESNRPLAAKLEQLVARASQEPPSAGLYTTLLADIEHHLGMLTRKAQAAERRHVEAAQGRERLDMARHRAGALMAERFAQSPPRGLLRALLDRAWSDVLALTLLRHGEQSDAFQTQLKITDQLLGRLPIDSVAQLQQQVESGLQQIGMHAEEAVQVAQRLLGAGSPDPAVEIPSATDLALRLKQHHRLGELANHDAVAAIPVARQPATRPAVPAAAAGSAAPVDRAAIASAAPATTTNPAPNSPAPAPAAPTIKAPSSSMPTPGKPAAAAPATAFDPRVQRIEQHLRQLPFGSWFEFVDPASGQILRRKLAWYSPMSGRCLLVSRRGQRGEEMSMAQLAQEIAGGRVCEVPEQPESLLDRAWRGLTGSLRQGTSPRRAPAPERPSR